jgi:type III secretion protein J
MNAASTRSLFMRYLVLVSLCLTVVGCSGTALYSELDETQANEITAALLQSGLAAEKKQSLSKTAWEVQVPSADIPYAMQVLDARGLPRERHASMCEIFKKEGFASSSVEEKARYICSLNQELSRTLSRIDGVVEARVHIALPDRDPLGANAGESSASVMIFERSGAKLRDRETDMKVFVKDSVEGLDDVNKVSVKFFVVPAAPQARSKPVLSAINPAVMVFLALLAAVSSGLWWVFGPRLRAAVATAKPAPQESGLWKG